MAEKLSNPFKISELVETVNNLVDTTVDDSNLVHKTGNETIGGRKTYTNSYLQKNTALTKGTLPSSANWWVNEYTDKNGSGTNNRLACIEYAISTNGDAYTNLRTYKYTSNNSDNATLSIVYPTSGNPFATAPIPTTTTSTDSTQIATTGWVNKVGNNVVHKTGNETIGGTKTFNTDYTAFKGTNIDVLNNPTILASVGINYEDVSSVVYGQDLIRTETNGNLVNIKAVKSHNGDNWANLVIGFDANDNVFTSAPTPDTSDNSTNIATTAWVKNQGYMSSGNIFPNNTWVPVGDDAYMGDHNQSGGVCIKGNNNNTAIYLFRRDETASNGFRLDENDANGLKIINPTQGAQAWCAVTAMIAESYGSNGYIKFNHGLIIQWGIATTANATYNFSTPFSSDTSYSIAFGLNYNGDSYSPTFKDRNKSSFTYYCIQHRHSTWIAVGY